MQSQELLQNIFPGNGLTWWELLKITGITTMEEFVEEGSRVTLLGSLNFCLQKQWLRPATKERWELDDDYFSDRQKIEIMQALEGLRLYSEVTPSKKHYDAVFLMASLEDEIKSRLSFLMRCWNDGVRFQRIYALSGYRELIHDKEPTANTLKYESEMMQQIMGEMINSKSFPGVNILFVNSPKKPGATRSTTKDTIQSWVQEFHSDGTTPVNDRDILLVSSQPYVAYQGAIATHHLSDGYNIEAVGHEGTFTTISEGLDTLARTFYVISEHFSQT